ncbi:MAG: LD-carboxypeptidase, partial [Cyclobacteriaceae bacterium]|nr:LD-carboxypeptidase [Cyclobacteriaceae bacterium]
KSSAMLPMTYTTGKLYQPSPPPLQKPAAIPRNNARVGLITPAGALTRSAFEKTVNNLEQLGMSVSYSSNLRVRADFLSGTDQQRIDDIHSFFSNDQIDAILCARGGYGTTRLLDSINYDIIRANPKPFIGYSDITALLSAFYKHAGLVCFHGPVGASEFNDFTITSFQDTLVAGEKTKLESEYPFVIQDGVAEGRLFGGNLSLLTSLLGTPHDVDYAGHILCVEEIGESPYRIDRMLTQLLSAGKLQRAAGIALGYFTNCDTKPDDPHYEYSIGLMEIFHDRLSGLGIPVVFGFPFGHEKRNATFPIGINAILDASKGKIKLLESAVA